MASGKFIAYYRVSTARQGASGLGLEAQRKAVSKYLDGGKWEMIGEYTEIESGRKNDRPKLLEALRACRLHRAKLIIAKLDRLARNVAFVSNLMESRTEFVAVDFPEANRLTVHILAAVAEHEREMISQRTKAALQAAKARGTRLGNPNLKPGTTTKMATAAKIAKANDLAAQIIPLAHSIGGSNASIARTLNAQGIATAQRGHWHAASVARLFRRSNGNTLE